MIEGQKTPKTKAQDLLMDKIANCLGYWAEDKFDTDGMTDREIRLVNDQMKKQADRIAKMFGFDEAWIG